MNGCDSFLLKKYFYQYLIDILINIHITYSLVMIRNLYGFIAIMPTIEVVNGINIYTFGDM